MTKLGKLAFLLMALVCLALPAFSQCPATVVHVKLMNGLTVASRPKPTCKVQLNES